MLRLSAETGGKRTKKLMMAVALLACIFLFWPSRADACVSIYEDYQVCADPATGCDDSRPNYECGFDWVGGYFCFTGYGVCCNQEYHTHNTGGECVEEEVRIRPPQMDLQDDELAAVLVPESCRSVYALLEIRGQIPFGSR